MLEWLLEGGWFFRERGDCGAWQPWEQFTYIGAEATTGVAYFALAIMLEIVVLAGFSQKMWMTHLFAAFIFACGLVHFVEGVGSFWYANYRLFMILGTIRAVLSVGTAILFPVFLVELAKAPTMAQVEAAWQTLDKANNDFQTSLITRLNSEADLQKLANAMAEATAELARLAKHDTTEDDAANP